MQTDSLTMRDFYRQSCGKELTRELERIGKLFGDTDVFQTVERATRLFTLQFRRADTKRKAVIRWQRELELGVASLHFTFLLKSPSID